MNIARIILAAIVSLLLSAPALGDSSYEKTLETLNDDWAKIFYTQPMDAQAEQFKALLARIRELKSRYPGKAEPLVLEAVALCTLVGSEWSFDALSLLDQAKELFEQSIAIDPRAMDATAMISLGNLYFRLPGWPISYGDDDKARQYLEQAVKLYPDAIDSNYFLGGFLLANDQIQQAIPYLEKAEKAQVRPQHRLSDSHTKGENAKALKAARKGENGHSDFFDQLLPSMWE